MNILEMLSKVQPMSDKEALAKILEILFNSGDVYAIEDGFIHYQFKTSKGIVTIKAKEYITDNSEIVSITGPVK